MNPSSQHHELTQVALDERDHPELTNRDSVELSWPLEPRDRDGGRWHRCWSAVVLDNEGVPQLIIQPSPWAAEIVVPVDEVIESLMRAKARLLPGEA